MTWIGLVDVESQTVLPAMIAGADKQYHSVIKKRFQQTKISKKVVDQWVQQLDQSQLYAMILK
jgi:hypothetical protein